MNMYDIINKRGNAAQRVAAARLRGIICKAIISAHKTDWVSLEDCITELHTFLCAYNIGIYAMYGTCSPEMMETADNLTVSHEELYKIIGYIRKIYEMELKRK